jgi:hypothetical protein
VGGLEGHKDLRQAGLKLGTVPAAATHTQTHRHTHKHQQQQHQQQQRLKVWWPCTRLSRMLQTFSRMLQSWVVNTHMATPRACAVRPPMSSFTLTLSRTSVQGSQLTCLRCALVLLHLQVCH